MASAYSKIAGIILSVFLMFFIPVLYISTAQDNISQTYVTTQTSYFVDSIRTQGYITPDMYTEYVKKIDSTGNAYKVELEHRKQVVVPVYDDPTNPDSFQDTYQTNYEAVYTDDIMNTLFPTTSVSDIDRYYQLELGDYIHVRVTNVNTTLGGRFQQMLGIFTGKSNAKILVDYGGMVRDQNPVK